MSEAAIEATELVREFKKGPRAVDGIDLRVEPGEVYGFLGPNGAGKSTTVHMLTTLLPPTSGTARVGGHDIVREGPEVRAVIGAALQEAALDPFLTGAEHLRLQTALHGIRGADAKRRSGELLARVGLTQAADRKVGGYSGGMKRRLDLALALVHEPRILFLDEPTTGLDPQSRSALWDEVQRLASDSGVTVFLTTQYLEEADVLADRIGIIDHGRIVAEGTPEALKAEISRPTLEVIPADHGRARAHPRGAGPLRRAGQLVAQGRRRAPVGGRGPAGRRGARARCRGHPRPPPPAARADARRRLPREDRALAGGRRGGGDGRGARYRGGGRRVRRSTLLVQVGVLARRSVVRTLRQPAMVVPSLVFPLMLLSINSSGLESATNLPGFPTDSYFQFALAIAFVQGALFSANSAGTNVANDIESGFLNRLALTPLRRIALMVGQLAGILALGLIQAVTFVLVGVAFGAGIAAGVEGALVIVALSLVISLAFGCIGAFVALRSGSGEAVQGVFPLFFAALFLSSMSLPRNLIETDWFRTVATWNPVSYMLEAIRSLVIVGWDAEALALGFACAGGLALIAMLAASSALRTRLVRT